MYGLQDIKRLRFRVICGSQPNFVFYFGILKSPTPSFSSVLILMVCLHFPHCPPFGKHGRFDFGMDG
jgi:hypothetical protein